MSGERLDTTLSLGVYKCVYLLSLFSVFACIFVRGITTTKINHASVFIQNYYIKKISS